jgi:2-iminobutanoate/2-iminopropanoate deaminase
MEFLNNLKGVPVPVGPYSQAVKLGETIYCSGQIGLDPNTGKLVEGIRAQIEQVMKNITAALEGAGSSVDRIALSTIFLTDMSNWPDVNEVYGKAVREGHFPARQTVAVKALPLGALVEISVIATTSSNS